MTTDRQLDDRISRWLEAEAPTQLPDRVLRATFDRTRKTRQQGGWRALLGRMHVNRFLFALGGAVVVLVAAALALGISVNNPSPRIGGPGSPSPSPAPPRASVVEPTAPTLPALTETFTSDIHGMSVSYPSGWNLQPATEPWNGDVVNQDSPFADVIYETEEDSPFIALASQPLAGQSFDDWANAYLTKLIADDPSCANTPDPITVDGAAGVVPGGGCDDVGFVALVSDGQRGYLIWLYRVDDREWFDEILATVRLRPAEAQQTPADGSLPEGTFVLSDGEFDDGVRNVPITVTIPARGWYGEPGNGFLEKGNPAENFGPEDAGLIGPFVGDIYVPADPCKWTTTMPDTPATTVDEVVAALQGQASRDASEPVDITVDGRAGKSITLHVPDDAVFGECDRNATDPGSNFCTLTQDDPEVCHRYHQFPGQIDELWVVDVDGEVTVIDATWGDATPAEDVAELRAILNSMQFETP